MNISARRSFLITSRALAGLGMSLALGWGAAGQTADADDVITVGPVNVYTFRPPEAAGQNFDVHNLNLRRVFEALGPDATLWYQHVVTLSNAYFEGRAPGLAGNRHAAEYIEFYMREYGLEPAFPAVDGAEEPGGGLTQVWTTYRQPFEARGRATDNVGGVLRGRGALADEWVIIGAHYDHVGYGNRDSLNKAGGTLHPGADDNASGTAGMLILAKQFAEAYTDADDDLRSILFMGFSAEEMGLLGSRYYVRNSTLDAEKINIMINLDMIGRLRDDTMLIGGVGSAEGLLDKITPHILDAGLKVNADPAGRGPSDHANFYGAGIPVLFMFTGTHSVYHQPGDHGYTINPLGAARIIDFTSDIAWDMVTERRALQFTRANTDNQPGRGGGPGTRNRPRGGGDRASLGIMPEYDADLETGVKVDRVFDNSAAKRAGLQPGDVILAWNGDAIGGGSALMRKLSDASAGDSVTLTIERDGERRKLEVKFSR